MNAAELPQPEELLPHRRPMLLLTRALEHDDAHLIAEAMVGEDSPLAVGGLCTSLMAIEMGAQAAAYHATLPHWRSGAGVPDKGFLVRLRGFEIRRDSVPAAARVRVEATLEARMGNLAQYQIEVNEAGTVLLRGMLAIVGG